MNLSYSGVIVAHPGTQHAYETALAVQQAGLLKTFATGIYYKSGSVRFGLAGLVKPFERELRRRCKKGLDNERVRTYPLGEIVQLATARLRPLKRYVPSIVRWRNERFDTCVAKLIECERPSALICYDGCALQAFRKAEELGILRVLDQSIGHWLSLVDLMREEGELHPDFLDSLPIHLPDWWLARRREEALHADIVLAGSEYVKTTMVRHSVDASRIIIIPYGADTDRFYPLKRSDSEICRLLFVGQLSQRKGIKYLLEAVKQLSSSCLELTLIGGVGGSGRGLLPYRDHFRHVSNVPHHEIHEYYQQADVFVYPSLHEGSAIAIYEALASGLPVITTPNSGSVVRDGIDGFIVPIRDIEALKTKISLLLTNKGLREEMSSNARGRAEEFTWRAYRRNIGSLLRARLVEVSPLAEAVAGETIY